MHSVLDRPELSLKSQNGTEINTVLVNFKSESGSIIDLEFDKIITSERVQSSNFWAPDTLIGEEVRPNGPGSDHVASDYGSRSGLFCS